MKLLTTEAVLRCTHKTGVVELEPPTQSFVTIVGVPVLVKSDPEGCKIKGCPNSVTPMKACLKTLAVEVGYSDLLYIDDRQVCLDNLSGKTDGTPPGMPQYVVATPGQDFVSEET